jgi:hypothetical protein
VVSGEALARAAKRVVQVMAWRACTIMCLMRLIRVSVPTAVEPFFCWEESLWQVHCAGTRPGRLDAMPIDDRGLILALDHGLELRGERIPG